MGNVAATQSDQRAIGLCAQQLQRCHRLYQQLDTGQPTGGNQTFTIPDQGAAGSYTLLTTAAASGQIHPERYYAADGQL